MDTSDELDGYSSKSPENSETDYEVVLNDINTATIKIDAKEVAWVREQVHTIFLKMLEKRSVYSGLHVCTSPEYCFR